MRRSQVENEQDVRNTTASDFTVMIEDLPKHFTKETLQQRLDEYYSVVQQHIKMPDQDRYPWDNYDGRFTISRFNTARAYHEVIAAVEQEEEQNPL